METARRMSTAVCVASTRNAAHGNLTARIPTPPPRPGPALPRVTHPCETRPKSGPARTKSESVGRGPWHDPTTVINPARPGCHPASRATVRPRPAPAGALFSTRHDDDSECNYLKSLFTPICAIYKDFQYIMIGVVNVFVCMSACVCNYVCVCLPCVCMRVCACLE